MRERDKIEDPRRLFLVRALASGLFMVGALSRGSAPGGRWLVRPGS